MWPVGSCSAFQRGSCLSLVVVTALRVPVTQAGPAARLVGDVVLEVRARRWAAAARPGARGVPDLGQVPEQDPGIVTLGLVPVIAGPGGDGLQGDEQVPLPGSPGGERPGAVSAGRAGLVRRGEGERRRAGRIRAVFGAWFMTFRGVCPAAGGGGAGAAMADSVPVLVGHGHAPGGPGGAGRRGGQVTGQIRIEGADTGHLTGPVREVQQGGQRDGQVGPAGEPGRDHPGQRPGRSRHPGPPRTRPAIRAGAAVVAGVTVRAGLGVVTGAVVLGWLGVVAGAAGAGIQGAGVDAEENVEERPGAEQIHAAVQARLAQLPGPPGDPLISSQHLRRRQLPAGQARIPRRLRPPRHPRLPGPILPPLTRHLRVHLHHRPADRRPQPRRSQRTGPIQDHRLRRPRLGRDPATWSHRR